MEFTEAIPAFGGLVAISPDGGHFARILRSGEYRYQLSVQAVSNLTQTHLINLPIYDPAMLQVKRPISKHFPPEKPPKIMPGQLELIWSPNSKLILVAYLMAGRVIVVDLEEEEGLLLKEMPGGLVARIFWAPDSKHLISVFDHQIGIKVWSLKSRYPVKIISDIKSSHGGISFCPKGNIMAVLHRKDAQDYIVIYNCSDWKAVQYLRPPEASFIDDIKVISGKYSRNHRSERSLIYAWELPCLSSRIFVFEPDGSCKIVDVTCGPADMQESTGFSKLVSSPKGDIAALATGDNSLVLWNTLVQKPIARVTISLDLARHPNVVTFKERSVFGDAKLVKYESGYDLMLTELYGKGSKTLGVDVNVSFSSDSTLLAIVAPALPNHLWIYHVPSLSFVAVLSQLSPITAFCWHPRRPLLTLLTGSDFVYFWQPEGCHCIPQPFEESTCSRNVSWLGDADLMLLAGPSDCCLAHPEWLMS